MFYRGFPTGVSDGYNPPDTSIQSEVIMGQGFKVDGEIAEDIIRLGKYPGTIQLKLGLLHS